MLLFALESLTNLKEGLKSQKLNLAFLLCLSILATTMPGWAIFCSMRTPSDDLFQLIKSMKPAEKRYFKQHFDLSGGLKIQLFDMINAQKVYDEEAIKAEFAGTSIARSLKVHKVQLMNLLLTSLIASRRSVASKRSIRLMIQDASLLLDQNILGACLKKSEEALLLAEREEAFSLMLRVIEIKSSALRRSAIGNVYPDPKKVIAIRKDLDIQRLEVMRDYTILSEMRQLSALISEVIDYDQSSNRKSRLKALLRECLDYDFCRSSRESSTLSIHYFGLVKTCYLALEKTEEVSKIAKYQLDYARANFDNCPMTVKAGLLLGICNNLLHFIELGDHLEIDYWIQFADKALKDAELHSRVSRIFFFVPQILSYRKRGLFEHAANLYPSMQKYNNEKKYHAHPMTQQLQLNFALIAVVTQRWELLEETLPLIQKNRDKLDQLLPGVVEVIELIFLYEEGQHKKLTARLKSLQKKDEIAPYLVSWMNMMLALVQTSPLEVKKVLKKGLHELMSEQYDYYRNYTQLYVWVRAQVKGTNYLTELKSSPSG